MVPTLLNINILERRLELVTSVQWLAACEAGEVEPRNVSNVSTGGPAAAVAGNHRLSTPEL